MTVTVCMKNWDVFIPVVNWFIGTHVHLMLRQFFTMQLVIVGATGASEIFASTSIESVLRRGTATGTYL